MSLKVPTASRVKFADILRGAFNGATGLYANLYQSAYTPVDGSVLADFTSRVSTFPGYAHQPISNWVDGGLDASNRRIISADPVTFTLTSGTEAVYGYYITDGTPTILYWAELDPGGPVTLDTGHTLYLLIPRLTVTSEF